MPQAYSIKCLGSPSSKGTENEDNSLRLHGNMALASAGGISALVGAEFVDMDQCLEEKSGKKHLPDLCG